MASINIKYKGLTGLLNDLTIDDGQTMAQLRSAIISDEGLSSSYYSRVSIHKNGLVKDSTDDSATTLASAGIVAGDIITVASERSQANKEANQLMTLEIAQLKRKAGGDTTKPYYRQWNTYDQLALSLPYADNSSTLEDDANTYNPLLPHRPWVTSVEGAAPASPEEAVSESAFVDLQIWYDGADTSTLIPSATDEGQITQWTDKSVQAHNANPNGGSAKPSYENTTLQNGYGYLEFDGNDNLSVNPFTQLQSQAGFTVFMVSKLLNTTGVQYLSETNQNDLRMNANGTTMEVGMNGVVGTVATTADTNWARHTLVFDGSKSTNADRLVYRKDGAAKTLSFTGTVAATTNASNTHFYIGDNTGKTSGAEAYIAEVLLFNRTLNAIEITNVESYLETKWGL